MGPCVVITDTNEVVDVKAESMDLHRGKTSSLETNWLRVEDSGGVCSERVAHGMVDRNR